MIDKIETKSSTCNESLKIGVSSCLLGIPVRYDGGHQQDRFITDTLGLFFRLVPVCPEFECGLGVPRETMRLVGTPAHPRLVTTHTGIDLTERMLTWARQRVSELAGHDLSGFIFKSKSPSSGLEGVKVFPPGGGPPKRAGVGLFAKEFVEGFPLLPVIDELHLHDLAHRENFIERVFACQRWRQTKQATLSVNGLIDFHTRHKLQIMAHSEKHYRAMGRLVAQTTTDSFASCCHAYEALLLEALRVLPTAKKHCNVLHHIVGYFKKTLSPAEKQELLEQIERFRHGLVPLLVPVTLLNHYTHQYQQTYLANQSYLTAHPTELSLRNHA